MDSYVVGITVCVYVAVCLMTSKLAQVLWRPSQFTQPAQTRYVPQHFLTCFGYKKIIVKRKKLPLADWVLGEKMGLDLGFNPL